jgi:hypothetical protein
MAYKHTNSKGVTYYLHKTEVTLRGGKPQTIYFFAKVEKNAKGTPVDLPEALNLQENLANAINHALKYGSKSFTMGTLHTFTEDSEKSFASKISFQVVNS